MPRERNQTRCMYLVRLEFLLSNGSSRALSSRPRSSPLLSNLLWLSNHKCIGYGCVTLGRLSMESYRIGGSYCLWTPLECHCDFYRSSCCALDPKGWLLHFSSTKERFPSFCVVHVIWCRILRVKPDLYRNGSNGSIPGPRSGCRSDAPQAYEIGNAWYFFALA